MNTTKQMQIGAGLSELGQALPQFGQTLGNIYIANSKDDADKRQFSYTKDIEDFFIARQTDTDYGNVVDDMGQPTRDGYMKKFDEFWKQKEADIEKIGNPLVKKEMQAYIAQIKPKMETKTRDLQLPGWRDKKIANTMDTTRKTADALVRNGNLQEAMTITSQNVKGLVGFGLVSEQQALTIMDDEAQRAIKSSFYLEAERINDTEGTEAALKYIKTGGATWNIGNREYRVGDEVRTGASGYLSVILNLRADAKVLEDKKAAAAIKAKADEWEKTLSGAHLNSNAALYGGKPAGAVLSDSLLQAALAGGADPGTVTQYSGYLANIKDEYLRLGGGSTTVLVGGQPTSTVSTTTASPDKTPIKGIDEGIALSQFDLMSAMIEDGIGTSDSGKLFTFTTPSGEVQVPMTVAGWNYLTNAWHGHLSEEANKKIAAQFTKIGDALRGGKQTSGGTFKLIWDDLDATHKKAGQPGGIPVGFETELYSFVTNWIRTNPDAGARDSPAKVAEFREMLATIQKKKWEKWAFKNWAGEGKQGDEEKMLEHIWSNKGIYDVVKTNDGSYLPENPGMKQFYTDYAARMINGIPDDGIVVGTKGEPGNTASFAFTRTGNVIVETHDPETMKSAGADGFASVEYTMGLMQGSDGRFIRYLYPKKSDGSADRNRAVVQIYDKKEWVPATALKPDSDGIVRFMINPEFSAAKAKQKIEALTKESDDWSKFSDFDASVWMKSPGRTWQLYNTVTNQYVTYKDGVWIDMNTQHPVTVLRPTNQGIKPTSSPIQTQQTPTIVTPAAKNPIIYLSWQDAAKQEAAKLGITIAATGNVGASFGQAFLKSVLSGTETDSQKAVKLSTWRNSLIVLKDADGKPLFNEGDNIFKDVDAAIIRLSKSIPKSTGVRE